MENKIRTPGEREQYMDELRAWFREQQDVPAEGMADFFARRMEVYEQVHLGHWPEEYAHIADYLRDGLNTLLDIGCGTGLELEAVYRRFPEARVTGIDLSREMLDALMKKFKAKRPELIQGDYLTLPFGTERYDAALSFETLHHFEYPQKKQIYEKLCRSVRRGGYYVECDYIACCEEEEQLCLQHATAKRRAGHIPDGTLIHVDIPLTLEHQADCMRAAGFRRVEVLYQNGSTAIFRAERAD